MPDQVTLSIETPGAEAQRFDIEAEGEITIGRDDTCTVVLASPDVSRRHITLEVNPTFVLVHDSSSNGTRVGEIRVHKNSTRVPFGTPMYLGPYIVRVEAYRRDGAAPVPSRPAPGMPPPVPPRATGHAMGTGQPTIAPLGMGRKLAPRFDDETATPGQPRLGPAGSGPQPVPPTTTAHAPATGSAPAGGTGPTGGVSVPTRKKIHRQLLENLDLASLDRSRMDEKSMRPRVRDALKRIIASLGAEVPPRTDIEALINELTDEALGLGPLEHFLADPTISEIMVVDSQTIFIEKKGKLVRADARFTDDEAVRAVIERIVTPLGRRIDESTPLVDARLKDGSRVNAVIKPLALKGSCITIRKFA
ncbi:MAG: ATPase, T2SS/T4P/T4SS family, partial [Deltaproteobacteria bacterium]